MDPSTTALTTILKTCRGYLSFEHMFGMVMTLGVLYFEVMRRAPGNLPRPGIAGNKSRRSVTRYVPECIGLCVFCCISMYLRLQGADTSQLSAADNETYAKILQEWPLLLGADSLLAMQAMLRVLILASNVFRAGSEPTLFVNETAMIAFGAAVGRVLLAAQSSDYMLDGPLGGYLPVWCELLSAVLLAVLCLKARRGALTASLLTLVTAAWIAYRNHLSLSENAFANGLFLFAHAAELFAAFAFLSRSLFSDSAAPAAGGKNVALRFTHFLMPVQQCLAAYYFVQAFEAIPELVGSGRPFEILQIGGVAQVGAYSAAAVLHLAEYLESPSEEPPHPPAEERAYPNGEVPQRSSTVLSF